MESRVLKKPGMPKTGTRVGHLHKEYPMKKIEMNKMDLINAIMARKAASATVSAGHCCGGTHCCGSL